MEKRILNLIYNGGILYGVFVLFTAMQATSTEGNKLIDSLLIVSVSHVLILSAYSFFGIRKNRSLIVGSKIQTVGYLHTLIGFIVAVIRLQKGGIALEQIFMPIGSALSTSLLGWWLGGIITDTDAASSELKIKTEAEKLAAELSGFSAIIRDIQERYIKSLKEASDQIEVVTKKQASMYLSADKTVSQLKANSEKIVNNLLEVIDPVEDAVSSISATLQKTSKDVETYMGTGFSDTLKNINQQFDQLSTDMKNADDSIQSVAKYLSESRALMNEMEKLLDLIIKEKTK
ncbi:MAG: hypothetical protein ACX93O_11925 [Flagellimonas sp.]